jgi:hypothetical protein
MSRSCIKILKIANLIYKTRVFSGLIDEGVNIHQLIFSAMIFMTSLSLVVNLILNILMNTLKGELKMSFI